MAATVLLLASVAAICILILLVTKSKRPSTVPPPEGCTSIPWTGDWYLPLLGETLTLVADPKKFLVDRWEKYGPLFHTSVIGERRVVCVCGGEAVKAFFKQDSKMQFWFPGTIGLIFGGPNPFFSVDLHGLMRGKLSLPMLSSTAIGAFMPTLKQEIDSALTRWRDKIAEEGPIALVPAIKALAWRISLKYVLGQACTPKDEMLERWQVLFEATIGGTRAALPWPLPGTALAKSLKARDLLLQELEAMIQRCRSGLQEMGNVDGEQIDTAHHGLTAPLLFDASLTLTDRELAYTILSLLFAANDTTSDTLCAAYCRLYASNPELRHVRKKLLDSCHQVNWATFTQEELDSGVEHWAYIDGSVREVVRLYGPSTFTFRKCAEPISYKDMYAPPDSMYLIALSTVLRDPEVFPDPEAFEPERFIRDATTQDGTGMESLKGLVSFGGGKHSCLGKRFAMTLMRTLIIRLFQRFPEWDAENVVHNISIDAVQDHGDIRLGEERVSIE